jgi:hypothetical protein
MLHVGKQRVQPHYHGIGFPKPHSAQTSNSSRNVLARNAQRKILRPCIGAYQALSIVAFRVALISIRQLYGPICLWNYLQRSAIVLAHRPSANAITEDTFVLERFSCTSCPGSRRDNLLAFSKLLGTEVQKAIAKVGGSLRKVLYWAALTYN